MQTPSPSRTTKTSSSEAWQCTGQLSLPGGMSEWLSPVSTEPAAAPSSRELSPNSPRSRNSGSTSSSRTTFGGRTPGSGSSGSGSAPSSSHWCVRSTSKSDGPIPTFYAREPVVAAGPRAPPVPVGEHVEAVRPRDERVRRPGRQVDEAGPRADLADDVLAPLGALPREAQAAEHEEDLLVVAVRVERCRAAARVDADAVHADADRAGGVTQVPPSGVDTSLLVVVLLDVIPVRDVGVTHAGSIRVPGASAQ